MLLHISKMPLALILYMKAVKCTLVTFCNKGSYLQLTCVWLYL